MIQSLYSGASGLIGQQKNIDVISNNIANIDTDGYKKSRFDFQDCLYQRMVSPVDNSPEKNLQRGSGTRVYQTASILFQGAIRNTWRQLDFALEGAGFFKLENPMPDEYGDGMDEILYTREGAFYLSQEEDAMYLVDAIGRYVLDENNERILIEEPDLLQCDEKGLLFYKNQEGELIEVAKLGLVNFVNPGGLTAGPGTTFIETGNSGERFDLGEESKIKVVQGYLESSNVDYSEEMVRLIRAQRAYQLASRCVSTADQMMGVANNIRQ